MGSVQKRITDGGTVWKARYRGPDRRERSKTFGRKIDAERWLATQEADLVRHEWVDPALGRTRLGKLLEHQHEARSNRETTKARDESLLRLHVMPTFEDVAVGDVTPEMLDEWIARLRTDGLGPDSIRKAYGLVKRGFDLAVKRRYIVGSPCVEIMLPVPTAAREMRILTAGEVEDLAEAMPARFRVWGLTAAYTGMRFGELAGLVEAKVDLDGASVTVDRQATDVNGRVLFGPPKTAASRRTIAIPSFLADELRGHLEAFPPGESGLVFAGGRGAVLRRQAFRRKVWLPAVEASVGLPLRPHDLRHTHVAMLIADGAHAKVIQLRLGHATIAVTMDIYGHLFDGIDAAAAEGLDEVRARSKRSRLRAVEGQA